MWFDVGSLQVIAEIDLLALWLDVAIRQLHALAVDVVPL
jgi:hypothetical protein